jgi:hypothetical protein
LKRIFWYAIISLLFFTTACSKETVVSVMDDISRDTYEKNARKERIENSGNPTYEEPPTYDQYQRERKEMMGKRKD